MFFLFTYYFIFSDKKGKSKKHDSSDDDEAQQSGKAKFRECLYFKIFYSQFFYYGPCAVLFIIFLYYLRFFFQIPELGILYKSFFMKVLWCNFWYY